MVGRDENEGNSTTHILPYPVGKSRVSLHGVSNVVRKKNLYSS